MTAEITNAELKDYIATPAMIHLLDFDLLRDIFEELLDYRRRDFQHG